MCVFTRLDNNNNGVSKRCIKTMHRNGLKMLHQNGVSKWYIKMVSQNGISKWYIKMVYQNDASKWCLKMVYQNGVSKWYTMHRKGVSNWYIYRNGVSKRYIKMVSQNGTSKWCLKLVYQNCVPKRSFSPSRDSRAGCFRHGHVPTQMHTSRFQRLIMRMDRRRGTRTKDSQKRSGLTWGLTHFSPGLTQCQRRVNKV